MLLLPNHTAAYPRKFFVGTKITPIVIFTGVGNSRQLQTELPRVGLNTTRLQSCVARKIMNMQHSILILYFSIKKSTSNEKHI
jgi:hypothetical protein